MGENCQHDAVQEGEKVKHTKGLKNGGKRKNVRAVKENKISLFGPPKSPAK